MDAFTHRDNVIKDCTSEQVMLQGTFMIKNDAYKYTDISI